MIRVRVPRPVPVGIVQKVTLGMLFHGSPGISCRPAVRH